MYKILNSLSLEMMNNIFKSKTNYYNTLNGLTFCKRNVKTVRYGLQTKSYMGPKIWKLAPKQMKQVTTPNEFKVKIKIQKSENVLTDSPELNFHIQTL